MLNNIKILEEHISAETENTINRIKYLTAIEEDICQVLKNLPAPSYKKFKDIEVI